MKKFILLFVTVLLASSLQAQSPEMADTMRANGKIYVIVAIILLVLVGLITYLIVLDRKVGKIEKQLENKG